MKKPVNPEAALLKAEKARRSSYYSLHNHVMSLWSFKRIKTFKDLLIAVGYDDEHISRYFAFELERTVVLVDVKDFLEDIRLGMEVELFLKRNPPQLYDNTDFISKEKIETGNVSNSILKNNEDKKELLYISLHSNAEEDSEEEDELPPSPNEKVFLFQFQKRAAKQCIDNIVKYNLHGQLLVAAAGLGKTYIYGAMLRRLLDMNFQSGKTMSPWPYCIITKASVIEQTKRVLRDSFGIDTNYQCMVTSYDQLRATFGKLFVFDETKVINGQEVIIWRWKPVLYPCVFILDESQAAKNETSQQSQIVVNISQIPSPHVYCVFVSATPFTRVSEAKYFVLNTKHNEKGMIV